MISMYATWADIGHVIQRECFVHIKSCCAIAENVLNITDIHIQFEVVVSNFVISSVLAYNMVPTRAPFY